MRAMEVGELYLMCAFPTVTTIMHEALNLKVFQQSSLGVWTIMVTESRKSNGEHAHRMGAALASVIGADGLQSNLKCVLRPCLGEGCLSNRQKEWNSDSQKLPPSGSNSSP